MRRLLSALVLALFAIGILISIGGAQANAAPSPLGTYDACVGTCDCQPKTGAPVVAAGSVTNECGMVSGASVSGNTVTAFAWGESATLSTDGSTLTWQDGSNWVRAATDPPVPPQDPDSAMRCRVHETAVSGVNWPGLDTWYGSCAEACQGNGKAWSDYYHSQFPSAPPFSYGLTPDGNGCIEYHAGEPYSTWSFQRENISRGKQAADKAKELEGTPYLWGGKGQNAKTGAPLTPQEIKDGYPYWNPSSGKLENGKGVDCSGFVKWVYNSTRGGSDIYVHYDNADGQYRNNSKPIQASELAEGDLLFFGDANNKSHVAIYMGGDNKEVMEAPGTGKNVRTTTLDEASKRPDFYGYARVTPPVFKGQVKAHSPIGISLTDPQGKTISDRIVHLTDSEILTEVPGELYYSVRGMDDQGMPEDTITLPNLKPGNYFIKPTPKPSAAPTDTYSLDVTIGEQVFVLAQNVPLADIPPLGYGLHVGPDDSVTTLKPVKMMIKPGDNDPAINPRSKGVLTVAVISDHTFDATTVSPASLRLGPTGTEALAESFRTEDINGDGRTDMLLKFRTQKTSISCAATALQLTGEDAAAQQLWATTPVRLSGCPH